MNLFGGCKHKYSKWSTPYEQPNCDFQQLRVCEFCGKAQTRVVSGAFISYPSKLLAAWEEVTQND